MERLAALSDGIFGVAMTLLLLELRVPAKELIQNEGALRNALGDLRLPLVVYLMSFLTLGIFWVGQQTQLNHLARSERHLTWIHLAFLFIVTIMPFSTRLLIEFIHYRTALLAYWANIFLLGAMLYPVGARNSRRPRQERHSTPSCLAAICRRIGLLNRFTRLARLLCVFHPYWSIGFIVLSCSSTTSPRRAMGADNAARTLRWISELFDVARTALDEARRGLAEGGIPIGAALFDNTGKLLGSGHNRRVQDGDPSAHGETDAFRKAGRQGSYRDKIMVTTLAPCWYCSGLIRQFGIGTVVVGESVNFRGGIDWLQENGIKVIDLASKECVEMLAKFIAENPALWHEDIGEE